VSSKGVARKRLLRKRGREVGALREGLQVIRGRGNCFGRIALISEKKKKSSKALCLWKIPGEGEKDQGERRETKQAPKVWSGTRFDLGNKRRLGPRITRTFWVHGEQGRGSKKGGKGGGTKNQEKRGGKEREKEKKWEHRGPRSRCWSGRKAKGVGFSVPIGTWGSRGSKVNKEGKGEGNKGCGTEEQATSRKAGGRTPQQKKEGAWGRMGSG